VTVAVGSVGRARSHVHRVPVGASHRVRPLAGLAAGFGRARWAGPDGRKRPDGTRREDMVVKKSKRREWTAEDVRELKSLARQKTPAARIARKLKRTEGATRQKALTLNVSLNSRPAKRKTPK
jgi:hypothetical protein